MDFTSFVKPSNGGAGGDTENADTSKLQFWKHVEYIENHGKQEDDYEYCMTEFLRMSGIYWGVTALDIMDQLDRLDRKSIIEFVKRCQCPISGGFAPCEGHDPHMLYTLSAVQVLSTYDALDVIDCDAVVRYVVGLQQPDGSFFGDKWGEVDTRFSFCAVATLALLKRMEQSIDVDKAVKFVMSCCNQTDGGFGSKPGAESHAGESWIFIICPKPNNYNLRRLQDSFIAAWASCRLHSSCICWTWISWAGGCASDSCPRADSTVVPRSCPMSATPGGCSHR